MVTVLECELTCKASTRHLTAEIYVYDRILSHIGHYTSTTYYLVGQGVRRILPRLRRYYSIAKGIWVLSVCLWGSEDPASSCHPF